MVEQVDMCILVSLTVEISKIRKNTDLNLNPIITLIKHEKISNMLTAC